MVDGTSEDVAEDFRIIDRELLLYSEIVAQKTRIVCLNKADALTEEDLSERTAALEEASGTRVYVMSAVSGQGVQQVLRAIWTEISAQRAEAEAEEEQVPWRP